MRPLRVELGDVFNKLTVISAAERNTRGELQWNCLCSCGGAAVTTSSRLHSGVVASCGCIRRERTRALGLARRRHGHASNHAGHVPSDEYQIWAGMIGRCTRTTNPGYRNYGGRGITVCELWRKSFENFLHDMGERPSPDHSIDRINNNGNYEPGNCRWATGVEQSRNRRNNRLIKINGVTRTLVEWSERSGLPYYTIWHRLQKGWPAKYLLAPTHTVSARHRIIS